MALEEENELVRARHEKLNRLRAAGIDPFAAERFDRSHTVAKAVEEFAELEQTAGEGTPDRIITARVAGRIFSRRPMGKASFLDLRDESGRVQLYVKRDIVGQELFDQLELIDNGDFIGVSGPLFRTRTGEVSVEVRKLEILAKALRPLPMGKTAGDQHYNDVTDVELRYRQRYADLAVHPEVRDHFRGRSVIMRGIRDYFNDLGYMEVETPVLQTVAGGAAARPFMTHHNALDYDFKLRISLELYLKRLIVGGFEKVYEIGRVFRNEGISTRHNPEFTLLESYEAYANLEDIEKLVENLFAELATRLYGKPSIPTADGEISVAPPWRRLPMLEGIQQYAKIERSAFDTYECAVAACKSLGLDTTHEHNTGGIIEKIHERFVQPNLIEPTFITDFPLETSPLAKKRQDNPRLTRRFEGYVLCQELANAFSEINDPIDQRERFEDQLKQAATGDEEAHPMDEDFLRALEYGMPPTGGLGIGIDRLVMVLTNTDSIRDVLLFPQMKPEK